MGQPIHLENDIGETMTVYGPNQARIHIAQGWRPTEEDSAGLVAGADDLTAIAGVGVAVAKVLADANYRTYTAVAEAPPGDLVALDKISTRTVKGIQESAAELAANRS